MQNCFSHYSKAKEIWLDVSPVQGSKCIKVSTNPTVFQITSSPKQSASSSSQQFPVRFSLLLLTGSPYWSPLLNQVCSPTSLFHLLRKDGFPLHLGSISYAPRRGENGKMSQRIAMRVSPKSSDLIHGTTDLCSLLTTENTHATRTEQCIAALSVCQAEQVSSSFLLVRQGHLAADPQKSRVKPQQHKLQPHCN